MTQAAKEAYKFAKNTDNDLAEFKYYLSTINNLAYTLEGKGELENSLKLYNEVASDEQL